MSISAIQPATPINLYYQDSPITCLSLDVRRILFTFLPGNEVGKLACVCKNFRIITTDDHIWRVLFTQEFPEHPLTTQKPYREQYIFRFVIEKNWTLDRFQTKSAETRPRWSDMLRIFQDMVILGGQKNNAEAYDKNTLKHLYSSEGHSGVDLAGVEDDGNYLLSFASELPTGGCELKVLEKATGRSISCIPNCVNYILDNNQIFVNQGRGTIAPPFWESKLIACEKLSGQIIRTLDAQAGLYHLQADRACVYASLNDGRIGVWNKHDYSSLGYFDCKKNDPVTSFTLNDELLFSAHNSGIIRVWTKHDLKILNEIYEFQSETTNKVHLHLKLLDGLLVCNNSDIKKIWSLEHMMPICTLSKCYEAVVSGDVLYLGFKNGSIEARDKKNGTLLFQLQSPENESVFHIVISGSRLFAKTREHLFVWNLKNHSLLKTFEANSGFNIDGERVYILDKEQLHVWDYSHTLEDKQQSCVIL